MSVVGFEKRFSVSFNVLQISFSTSEWIVVSFELDTFAGDA